MIPKYMECPHCGEPHLDEAEFSTRLHHVHRCGNCHGEWDAIFRGVANPLAKLHPYLINGKIGWNTQTPPNPPMTA